SRGVLGLQALRPALEEALQLLLGKERDEVAGELAVAVGKVLPGSGRELVDVLRAAAPVWLRVSHGRQPVGLQGLQVAQRSLLRDREMGGDLAECRVPPGLEEGENALAPGIHELIVRVFQHGGLNTAKRALRRDGCW